MAVLTITNGPSPSNTKPHPLHQKNESLGMKKVLYGKEILIEAGDAKDIEVGEKITLMKWGNATVTSKKEKDGKIHLEAKVDEADTDFKKTKKLHWVTKDKTNFEVTLVELDHLITV